MMERYVSGIESIAEALGGLRDQLIHLMPADISLKAPEERLACVAPKYRIIMVGHIRRAAVASQASTSLDETRC